MFSSTAASITAARTICPPCYCCASNSHSHDKGMCPSCKHSATPPEVLKAPVPSPSIPPVMPTCPIICLPQPLYHPTPPAPTPTGPSTASPPLRCPGEILPWFPRRAKTSARVFHPGPTSRNVRVCVCVRDFNAAEGALLSNFILLPGIVSGGSTKGERACVRVSRGVCAYVHLGYTVYAACTPQCVFVWVCVRACARDGECWWGL